MAETLRTCLTGKGFTDEVITLLEDNDVDMEVLKTMGEADLREVGITSFGVRRKLHLFIKQLCSDDNSDSLLDSSSVASESDSQEDFSSPSSTSTPCKRTISEMSRGSTTFGASCSSTSITSFGIKETMSKHTEGKEIARLLLAGKILSISQRRILVRVAVGCLTEKCGLYPLPSQKTALAMEIVSAFPTLRDTSPGMKGHEHFYSNGQGFIEYRLKNVRSTRPQSEKMRKRSTKKQKQETLSSRDSSSGDKVAEPEEEIKEKMYWMKHSPPTNDPAKHLQLFKDTHKYRRQLMEKGDLTITAIISKFPRFQDMPNLINEEFRLMFGGDITDNFITKWDGFVDKIIAVGKKVSPSVAVMIDSFEETDSKDLCALYTLIYALHRSVTMSKQKQHATSRSGALLYFLQNKPIGTDIEAAAGGKDDRYSQPYIMALGPALNPTQFFIVADRMVIPAGTTLVQATDRLFKCHYIFNVHYALPLQQFWEFIAAFLYGVIAPSSVKSLLRSLASDIRKVSLE